MPLRWTNLLLDRPVNYKLNIALCALILLFGFSTRFIYIESISSDTSLIADAEKYYNLAKNIVEEGIYSHQAGLVRQHTTFITPGYPLFLSAMMIVSDNETAFFHNTVYFQASLSGLTVLLVFLAGREFLPTWAVLLAVLLAGISPQLIVASGYLLTEALFTFCLMLAVYILFQAVRYKSVYLFLLFGILAGYSSLVRPALILYPFLVAMFLWISKFNSEKFRRSLVASICVGVLLVWAPWMVWKNATPNIKSGPGSLVSSFALGSYPDLTYKTPAYRGYPYLEDASYKEMQKSLGTAIRIVGERAKQEPLVYATWYLFGKPFTYWSWGNVVGAGGPFIFPVRSSVYDKNSLARNSLVFSEISHPLWLISALGVALYFLQRIMRRHWFNAKESPVALLALLLIYFTAIHTFLAPLPRYSFPILPEMYIVAVYGLWRTGVWYKLKSEKLYALLVKNRFPKF